MTGQFSDYVVFNDAKLQSKYANGDIPMTTFIEAYFDGSIDLKCELFDLLEKKDDFVRYDFTQSNWKYFLGRWLPEVAIHSQGQDVRIARDHYDRGNDFFGAYLGERMVYTSAFFNDGDESLEEAQDNKMRLVCDKLLLKEGERLLDIGCGWGTLARFAAQHFNADATGVTIAQNQVAYGNERIAQDGLEDKARLLCLDYRDIGNGPYDKISCLEMAEHVGVRKFSNFLAQVRDTLTDDGMFFLQIAGLRKPDLPGLVKHIAGRGNSIYDEDRVWGLFMAKYIFPGADASMPLGWVIDKLEGVGFEVQSVETIGIHYSKTIHRWYDNWIENRALMVERYGERLWRIWHIFLAWSVQIARQGSSTAFQIVCHKNLNTFDRTRFIGRKSLGQYLPTVDERQAPIAAAPKKKGKAKKAKANNGSARAGTAAT